MTEDDVHVVFHVSHGLSNKGMANYGYDPYIRIVRYTENSEHLARFSGVELKLEQIELMGKKILDWMSEFRVAAFEQQSFSEIVCIEGCHLEIEISFRKQKDSDVVINIFTPLPGDSTFNETKFGDCGSNYDWISFECSFKSEGCRDHWRKTTVLNGEVGF